MKMLLRLLLVLLAAALAPVWSRPPRVALPPVVQAETSDGPHVLWEGSEATVYHVREGRVTREKAQGAFDLVLPGIAGRPVRVTPAPPVAIRDAWAKPEKILAISDIHGRFDTLSRLLKAQRVVDAELRWRFGAGHLVVVGDVMDRGPQVTEALWFLRSLEAQAHAAGGAVHVLLGNHEAMVLSGDVRYVNPKYLQAPEGLPPHAALYGPSSELGRWLRTRPVLLRLGDLLFLHGGISPEVLAMGLDLSQLNGAIRPALGLRAKEAGGAASILLGSAGPLWYRGLLPEGGNPQATEEHITRVLEYFQVRALVVGHTTLPMLGSFHDGRVIGIDAGIKDGGPGEALLWQKGRFWRARADGGREALER